MHHLLLKEEKGQRWAGGPGQPTRHTKLVRAPPRRARVHRGHRAPAKKYRDQHAPLLGEAPLLPHLASTEVGLHQAVVPKRQGPLARECALADGRVEVRLPAPEALS
jgi:hypothetical protein